MSADPDLAERFEQSRSHLHGVALRLLGSPSEADDAVQEAWLRLSRSDVTAVENLTGWLTTVVSRICLDVLRGRRARSSPPADADVAELPTADAELALADALGPALLAVLDRCSPPERVAFVLHDVFDLPFEDIAPILGRSVPAARQLASRGRRRVQGRPTVEPSEGARQRAIVDAFLAASRDGDLPGLVALLAPDVVLRADPIAVGLAAARREAGAPLLEREVRGRDEVAAVFRGRARAARAATIDGAAGAVWASDGRVHSAFLFSFEGDRIVAVDLVMERLDDLDVVFVDG